MSETHLRRLVITITHGGMQRSVHLLHGQQQQIFEGYGLGQWPSLDAFFIQSGKDGKKYNGRFILTDLASCILQTMG